MPLPMLKWKSKSLTAVLVCLLAAFGGAPASAAPKGAQTEKLGGSLSQQQVDGAVAANADAFARCASQDTFATARVRVNAAGKVLEASVSRSTPDNAVLRDCMVRALKAIAFPKPGGSYPIVLDFDLTVYPSRAGPGRKNRVAVKRR